MPNIRIIATPVGEAPEEIRKAWVGLVLPLRDGLDRPVLLSTFGVLTLPKSAFAKWFRLTFTKVPRREQYCVTAKVAIELLAQHNPAAAQWWFKNTPYFLESTKWLLGFEPEVCEMQ